MKTEDFLHCGVTAEHDCFVAEISAE